MIRRSNLAFGTATAALLLICAGAGHALAAGNIDSAYKYAWSDVGGWVNFAPTNGGVTVTDTVVTGYAWSANDGWINFSPAGSGVHLENGSLSGFAWDSTAGWIDFTGVKVSPDTGHWSGTATGGQVSGTTYHLTFDCTNCNVTTSWRPSRPISGGGCSVGFVWSSTTTRCIPASSASSASTSTAAASSASLAAAPVNSQTASVAHSGTTASTQSTVSGTSGSATTYPPAPAASSALPSASGVHATTTARVASHGISKILLVVGGVLLLLILLFFWLRRRF